MADKKSIDYQEALLEAMKIVSQKQIESISFDKTIEAIVTDASKALEGIYTVSTGLSQFTAYSTETEYKKDDAVMVTIPQGDFDKQKMIVGKQVTSSDNTPLIYKSPFQNFINLTDNLINGKYEISYWANKNTAYTGRAWDIDVNDFEESLSYSGSEELVEVSKNGLIWDSGEIFEQGYKRLGLQAQFSTWLNEYNTIAGNYGLALELTFKSLDISSNESNNLNSNTFTKIITFDSNEFFGDVYNFETYYTQEKVFNIEDFIDYPIVAIKLFAYQRNNFISFNNENIYGIEGLTSATPPNIFIKDPLICLGVSNEDFEIDTAEIICEENLIYKKGNITNTGFNYQQRYNDNLKTINLRWVHKNEETDIVKMINVSEFPANYEIRWYRYKIGEPSSDQFAGAHWTRFYGSLEYNENQVDKSEWNTVQESADIATNALSIQFAPNVTKQEEKIKVLIIKTETNTYDNSINRLIASSNILTFTNQDEVRNQTVFIDERALNIKFDETDDLKGNFFVYNQANRIEDQQLAMIPFKLIAVFDPRKNGEQEVDIYKKATLNTDDFSMIEWNFPTTNSMIIPLDSDQINELSINNDNELVILNTNTVYFKIKSNLNPTYNNNTIHLHAKTNDGDDYYTEITLRFGYFGDNGSDYSIIIDWQTESRQPILNLSTYEDNGENKYFEESPSLKGKISLLDKNKQVINWSELEAIKIQCDWLVAYPDCTQQIENVLEAELEEEDILYPIISNGDSNYSWSDYNSNDIVYKFDIASLSNSFGSFVVANSYTTDQLYRKRRNEENKKPKLVFNKIDFSKPGESYSPKTFFIKFKDLYIIDPWDTQQEVETYYRAEPVKKTKTIYSTNGGDAHVLQAIINDDIRDEVIITPNGTISKNALFILQITIKDFGDYDLIKYCPIALNFGDKGNSEQKNFVIEGISGPTEVLYYSDGTGAIDFTRNPYQLYAKELNDSSWIEKDSSSRGYNLGFWRLIIPRYNFNESNDQFIPTLIETFYEYDNDGYHIYDGNGWYKNPILNPISVYIPSAVAYGIQLIDLEDNGKILFTQPILCWQNRYQSGTLNKWNGKEITIDKDSGTVIASGFAAGKKENDNTFTGVMLGDWSRTAQEHSVIAENTGIYGFNHGAMSYAFKDDGTGFIGKDGSGRIYFDGDKSLIYSSRWANTDNPRGMLLDIDDGILDIRGNNGANVYISPKSDRYFEIKDESGNSLLKVSSNNYYLQTSNFSEDGKTGVQLNLGSGRFTGYNFTIQANNNSNNENKYIKIDSTDNNYPLQIGIGDSPNFKVEWNGSLYSNSGRIGGWNIIDNSLNNSDENNENTTVRLYAGANRDLGIWAIRGTIGAWGIYNEKIFAPSTLEPDLIALINNSESRYKTYLLQPQLWYNTMLDSREGILTNQLTFYISLREQFNFYANLYPNQPNSILSSSTAPVPIMLGSGGLIIGNDGDMNTWGLGFRSSNNRPIMIEATNSNIRLSGAQGNLANGIFLHSETIEIGKSSGTNEIILSIQDKQIRIYKDTSDNNKIKISTNIDATNQTGIYARFAP